MKYIFENISVCYYFLDIFQQILKERERERERVKEKIRMQSKVKMNFWKIEWRMSKVYQRTSRI